MTSFNLYSNLKILLSSLIDFLFFLFLSYLFIYSFLRLGNKIVRTFISNYSSYAVMYLHVKLTVHNYIQLDTKVAERIHLFYPTISISQWYKGKNRSTGGKSCWPIWGRFYAEPWPQKLVDAKDMNCWNSKKVAMTSIISWKVDGVWCNGT